MKLIRRITTRIADLGRVMARELQLIVHDQGVMIFFVLLPLMYPIVYTLIYNPEVLEKLPVAVVDQDRTEASRKLVRDASASPAIRIYDYVPEMGEARRLVAERKVNAILYIPQGYGKKIGRVQVATASLYIEMSLLLRYRDLYSAITDVQLKDISDITASRAALVGQAADGLASGMPIDSQGQMLGDTQQGFASFIMPGILVLILQQSMILGICMLAGNAAERRRRNNGIDPLQPRQPSWMIVLGRALTYTVFYVAASIYLLHWIPELFNLPHWGDAADWLLLMLPFMLASAFFGLTIAQLVTDRESCFLIIVISSVFFLFLTGLTWPRYAMPAVWKFLGDLIPGAWGVEAFISINSNGATLAENSTPYLALWGLSALYFVTSAVALAIVTRRKALTA